MAVEIKEVLTKKELRTFVRFPDILYRDNEFFVPFLESDEVETFSKDKNPAYAFCETRLFLAYQNGEVVGRIAGLINHAYNDKWKQTAIRFTRSVSFVIKCPKIKIAAGTLSSSKISRIFATFPFS